MGSQNYVKMIWKCTKGQHGKFVSLKRGIWGWIWWWTSIIPALRRLRQKEHEFKASMGYVGRTCEKSKQTNREKERHLDVDSPKRHHCITYVWGIHCRVLLCLTDPDHISTMIDIPYSVTRSTLSASVWVFSRGLWQLINSSFQNQLPMQEQQFSLWLQFLLQSLWHRPQITGLVSYMKP
jgi:hypothetical protein